MALSLYSASVPIYINLLKTMSTTLTKAEAHARSSGYDPATLLTFRLYPDMWHFHKQVQQTASLIARGTCRLAGLPVPTHDDPPLSFDGLRTRIADTIRFLEGVDPAAVDEGATREVTYPTGGEQRTMSGPDYFLTFTLPNVYFHATTAYDILRHNGVPLKKPDFLPSA
ncbi:MAG: DUF1993 family protein [Bauldia sp.]